MPRDSVTSSDIPKHIVETVRVVDYTDGDTITVLKDGKQIKIRLYGIDCPEESQAYSKNATKAIKQILDGRTIRIKIMDYDKNDRSVGLVYADGKSANRIIIQAGYA